MPIKVDMTDVKGFEPVPSGVYTIEVINCEETVSGENSKNPGSPLLKWTFSIIDPQQFGGRQLFVYTTLLPHALFTLKNLLDALEPEVDHQTEIEFEITDFIGHTCQAEVEKSQYGGRDTNNIKKFFAH